MTDQNNFTPVAPYAGLAAVVVEIISPVVSFMASGVVLAFTKLANLRKHSERMPSNAPAPHVAMVLVPGNFMTGPFTYR